MFSGSGVGSGASKAAQNGISVQTKEFDPLQEKLKTDKRETKEAVKPPSGGSGAQQQSETTEMKQVPHTMPSTAAISTMSSASVATQGDYYTTNASGN